MENTNNIVFPPWLKDKILQTLFMEVTGGAEYERQLLKNDLTLENFLQWKETIKRNPSHIYSKVDGEWHSPTPIYM